ncbi:MAG: hypothetical protein QXH24_00090 [Candidatus Bathyarchaeia archaeon]
MIIWETLIVFLIYFIVSMVAVGIYTQRKFIKKGIDFTIASRTLPWWLIASGILLIPFGIGNSLLIAESSWIYGSSILWWMVVGSALTCVVALIGPGRWFRRVEAESYPDALAKIFKDERMRIIGIMTSYMWVFGIATLELFGCAAALYGLTGLDLTYCVLIGFLLYFLYIIFGGMFQYTYLNILNVIVIYICIGLTFFGLSMWIAPIGGWEGATTLIAEKMGTWATTMLPLERLGEMFLALWIPILVAHTAAVAFTGPVPLVTHGMKSEREAIKGWPMALLLNGYWGWLWVMLGMLALVVPASLYGPMAPAIEALRAAPGVTGAVPAAIITAISTGTISSTAVLIALMAATISTGSACALYIASSTTTDIVKRYLNPNISERKFIWLVRIVAIGIMAAAIWGALLRGYLLGGFLWIFSSAMPVLIYVPLAFFWRRNTNAAIATTIINFIILYIWLIFYPALSPMMPSWMQALGFTYPSFIVSLILYPVLALALPGGKPGYLKEEKQEV